MDREIKQERGKTVAAKLTREEKYMKAAIREAKKAWALGEVPIGCGVVYEDKIIGRG